MAVNQEPANSLLRVAGATSYMLFSVTSLVLNALLATIFIKVSFLSRASTNLDQRRLLTLGPKATSKVIVLLADLASNRWRRAHANNAASHCRADNLLRKPGTFEGRERKPSQQREGERRLWPQTPSQRTVKYVYKYD